MVLQMASINLVDMAFQGPSACVLPTCRSVATCLLSLVIGQNRLPSERGVYCPGTRLSLLSRSFLHPPKMRKYIVVSGGVISGVGKGVIGAQT